MQGRRLLVRFTLISLALIAIEAAVVGWYADSYFTQSMLEREQTVTVDYMRQLIRKRIAPEALKAAWQLRSKSEPLRRVAEDLMLLPEFVRVKIYDPNGRVIWSDVPGLVGKDFHDDPSVRKALAGTVLVELEQMDATPEHQFEHPLFRELMSIYVPFQDDQTKELLAVFEIYKNPQFLYQVISQGRVLLWMVVLLGGGVLCLAQMGLVTAASRTIDRQYTALREDAERLERTNRQLSDTQSQLVHAERFAALGKVTAAVAHGVRNPLANIRLVTQETREGLAADHPLREPLTDVITQVDLLEERLRNFLGTAGPMDLILTRVHLLDVIRTVVDGMKSQLAERAVQIKIQPFAGDCSVRGDALKLEEVVRILLTNSIEAGAKIIEIGHCQIVERPQGRSLEFHVVDDGSGLAPETISRLFEPFFTTKSLGTGLGLVIAKRMLEAHGGALGLRPGAAHGVDAKIVLPLSNSLENGGDA